jgi:hypothetical protein
VLTVWDNALRSDFSRTISEACVPLVETRNCAKVGVGFPYLTTFLSFLYLSYTKYIIWLGHHFRVLVFV